MDGLTVEIANLVGYSCSLNVKGFSCLTFVAKVCVFKTLK